MYSLILSALTLAGTLQVDVLDVGQGDSILIRTPAGKSILIDAGTGGDDVPPMLRELGVESLSMIIASHPHADHIGGLDEVVEAFPPKVYIDNGMTHTTAAYETLMQAVEQSGASYATAESGWSRTLDDGIVIEFLGPPDPVLTGTRSDHNSNSVITRITHGSQCFLFTGDAEEPTEHLLRQRGIEPCNVLKVAHHGSAHSTTDSWLRSVQPEIALISCGESNRYGHPAEETLSRIESSGAEIFRTDLNGRIHLESDGEKVIVTTERVAGQSQAASTHGDASMEAATSITINVAPPQTTNDDAGLVNINKATMSELDALPGIGPSKAAAILEYRGSHGAFTSIEQLDHVPGIGPATMAKLRPLVTF